MPPVNGPEFDWERSRCVFVPDAPLSKGAEVQIRFRAQLLIVWHCHGVGPGLVRNSLMACFALPGKIVRSEAAVGKRSRASLCLPPRRAPPELWLFGVARSPVT
jgi:hypothetical protein